MKAIHCINLNIRALFSKSVAHVSGKFRPALLNCLFRVSPIQKCSLPFYFRKNFVILRLRNRDFAFK